MAVTFPLARSSTSKIIEAKPIGAEPIGIVAPSYPAVLNNAIVWLSNITISQSGGFLDSFQNKGVGGSSYDLDVITGQISIVKPNGLDALFFDGVSFVRPLSLTLLPQPNRIYCVYQLTNLTTQVIARLYDSYDSSTIRNMMGLNKFSNYHWIEAGNDIQTPNSSLTASTEISSCLFSGANSELTIDGRPTVTGNAGTQSWNYCTLGAEYNETAGAMMLGTIFEFIVFNGLLPTVSQDISIIEYLADKHKVTL